MVTSPLTRIDRATASPSNAVALRLAITLPHGTDNTPLGNQPP